MKKELYQIIEIPEGVEVSFADGKIKVKGKEGEIEKGVSMGALDFSIEGNKIRIGNKKSTKREKKMMNTIKAHTLNMIQGVQEKYEYKLKICFSHFPITVEIKGNEAAVKNFLGEKIPRKVNIPAGAEVKADKTHVTITSVDKEIAGQAAANFETATKIRGRDKRVFQDGIFMIEKAGREI